MLGKVLAIMNEKGGVGKSSLTFSVAWELAVRGKRVLMVDMDGQAANLSYLAGVLKQDSMPTAIDVLHKGQEYRNAVLPVESLPDCTLHILPATSAMAESMTTIRTRQMKEMAAKMRKDYDYVFFDVNPSPDWKHALTLSCLDGVVIAMLPDVMSLEADVGVIDSILEIQDGVNPKLKILGLVLNKCENRTNLGRAVADKGQAIAARTGSVWLPCVRQAVAFAEAAMKHVGITQYAPKSAVAGDIRSLTDALVLQAGTL